MPVQQAHERFQLGDRLQVSWPAIALFAGVLAPADTFWMVTLRGAVGAIEHTQEPFALWLRESALLAPVFAGAIVLALLAARQWLARGRRPHLLVAVAALVLATTVVAVSTTAATAMVDYRAQARQLGLLHTFHSPTVPRTSASSSGTTSAQGVATSPPVSCDALCRARQETVAAHVRGVRYVSLVILATNVMLSFWLIALRGGRLWSPSRRRSTAAALHDRGEPALA